MNIYRLSNFTKGWFIGDFDPTLLKTAEFEVGVKNYKKGDFEKTHFHKIATEFTVVLNGQFQFNDEVYFPGQIIKINPLESVSFRCLRSGKTLVVKVPSSKGDKYEIG